MTSATGTSWEKELRKNICTNFGRGIRVNGENSGRTKILYVYNEGLGSNDPEELAYYNKIREEIDEMKKETVKKGIPLRWNKYCLLYTSPSPRDGLLARMPSSA